jgi:hypothetical protein
MVQQQWTDLDHVVMVDLDEVKDFHTVRDDGLTFEAKPMLTHCRTIKAFLLFYKRNILWDDQPPTEEGVMGWTKSDFKKYCQSKNYHDDHVAAHHKPMTNSRSVYGAATSGFAGGHATDGGNGSTTGAMNAQEFRETVVISRIIQR